MYHASRAIQLVGTISFSFSFCFCAFSVSADQIQKPYNFTSGTPAKASEVNANFDALYNKVNQMDTQLASVALPAGVIVMWSGSIADIPSGWALCNGSNGTPDLRDKFVVAAGSSYSPGATGGSPTIDVPAHTHSISQDGHHGHHIEADVYNCIGDCTDGADNGSKTVGSDSHGHRLVADTWGAGDHSHGGQTGNSSGATVDNRPPYYALAFIMKR